jgi:hypothetical protein
MMVLFFAPMVIDFVLALCKNFVPRAAISSRTAIGSASLAVLFTAFCLLNVTLDNQPSQAVPAVVVRQYGAGAAVKVSMSWNQERIEQTIQGNRGIVPAKPGDAVHLVVHPGAFSVAWYSDVLRGD